MSGVMQACFIVDGICKGMVGYLREVRESKAWVTLLKPDGFVKHIIIPNDYYVIIDDDLITYGKFGPLDKED